MLKVALILLLPIFTSTVHSRTIQTENGKISGVEVANYYAYRGIKYAFANRFEPSQPYTGKWCGVKELKDFKDSCAHYDHLSYDFHGSEDCLYLNVFVPKKILESSEPAPVLFYIHGGAFMFGGSYFYQPDHVMEHEKMILVTINYRLGILGFLSTGDDVLPGNLGLKDQVEALKWVQRNIKSFNGNPDKVTLLGFSAGGASVQLHYLSPLSKGLFNNGISASGVALNPWVFMEKAREKAHKVAEFSGCPTDDHTNMVECLKNKPVKELVNLAQKFQPFLYNPFSPFGVVIETPQESSFIADNPLNLLKTGNFNQRPWFLSQTKDEGLYPAAEFYSKTEYLDEINDNWNQIVPYILHYNDETDSKSTMDKVSEVIREFYMGDKHVNRENFLIFDDIVTDRLFKYHAYEAIQLQSKYSPSFFYHFHFKSLGGIAEVMGNTTDFIGIAHGEDVFLVFNSDIRHVGFSDDERKMGHNLIDTMYEFAVNDQPKFDKQLINRSYPDAVQTLEIHSNRKYAMKMQDEKFGNVKFWKKIDKMLHHDKKISDEL